MKQLLISLISVSACYSMDDSSNHELMVHLTNLKSSPQTQKYVNEKCGICNKEGPKIPWISPTGRFAHHTCIELIKPAFEIALNKLDSAFVNDKNFGRWNKAHVYLISLIEKNIGKNKTIFEFIQQTNIDTLKKVVDLNIDDAINCVHQKSL